MSCEIKPYLVIDAQTGTHFWFERGELLEWLAHRNDPFFPSQHQLKMSNSDWLWIDIRHHLERTGWTLLKRV